MSVSDQPPLQPIRWEWRYLAGMLTLAFNGGMIIWLILYGRSENLLHQNALSWAFILSAGVLAGFGLGAVIDPIARISGASK